LIAPCKFRRIRIHDVKAQRSGLTPDHVVLVAEALRYGANQLETSCLHSDTSAENFRGSA
jgi:hypothetical protein